MLTFTDKLRSFATPGTVLVMLAAFCVSPSYSEPLAGLFSGDRVIYDEKARKQSYRLTLSPLKKINSEWLSEREIRMTGNVRRKTVEVDGFFSVDEAWSEIESTVAAHGARAIFQCEGLDCGSSNAWANTRFGYQQLYGLDQHQRYKVWELAGDYAGTYVVAYLVQRGNRRMYAQLDTLIPKKPRKLVSGANVLANELYANNQIEVSGLSFANGNLAIDEQYLSPLAIALKEKPFLSFYVVGHDFSPGTSEQQEARSKGYADQVAEVLIQFGINPRRIEVKGIGGASPGASSVDARVMVVLRRGR